jgi:hypothetical protein
MISIEHLEDVLWTYVTTVDHHRVDEATALLVTRDLGPLGADVLHSRGIVVNRLDGFYSPNHNHTPMGYGRAAEAVSHGAVMPPDHSQYP